MPAHQFVKLINGAKMPTLGLGTWQSKPGEVEVAVEVALKNGYRHIDTATAYGNEKEVGLGIKASGVPRSEIFLTTKLRNTDHRNVAAALEKSLQDLDTPYIDLWLMHWPCPMVDGKPDREISWIDTWKSMEKVYKQNQTKIRALGVSNFGVKWLDQLLRAATIIPVVNQVEVHPSNVQEDLVKFCVKTGISVTAYSPLGSDNAPLAKNEVVQKIAAKYDVTPANILISFSANIPGLTVLPKSVTPERIISNAKIIDLTEEEVKELADIEKTHHFRSSTPFWTGYGTLDWPDLEEPN